MKYAIAFLSWMSCCALFAQQWQQMQDFPGSGRDDGTVFVAGNKAYCGLGMNPWFGCNGDFYSFDLNSEIWAPVTSMPEGEARQYACGFTHNGSGYVFGGINCGTNYLNDLWRFDPNTNTWTEESALPEAGRAGAVCFVLADTVYIVGGKSVAAQAISEVWAYDLVGHSWTQKNSLPFDGMWRGVAFAQDGKGIIGLGKNAQGELHAGFYQYLPQQDVWQLIPGLTLEGTTYTAAAQIGSKAFLYGGMNASGTYLNTFTRIDLETFEIHALAPFPADARRGAMAFGGNDEFYLATGVSGTGRLNETWKAGYVLSVADNTAVEPQVFPNPSAGSFQVIAAEMIREITIFDLSGKASYNKVYNTSVANIETDLPAGVWLLQVKGESTSSVVRLVIEH